jgi:hypothetical protein
MLRIVRQPLAEAKPESLPRVPPLLQFRVLRLGFSQDGDVGVGVLQTAFCGEENISFNGVSSHDRSLADSAKAINKFRLSKQNASFARPHGRIQTKDGRFRRIDAKAA